MLKKSKLFGADLVLIVFGYIISLNPYWWIFGTPLIFIGGVILAWLSEKSLMSKILLTLLPILLWLPGFWAFVYLGSSHMTPETFLIPQNFRGKITLYYNEPCGQELQKVDGRYIYHIPSNGVMIIKNPFETGIIDQNYYFVDSSGKKINKIDLLDQRDFNEEYTTAKNPHEPPRNKVVMFLGGTGGSGTINGVDEDHYKFHEMFVNSWDSLRVFNNEKSEKISLLALRNCRASKTN